MKNIHGKPLESHAGGVKRKRLITEPRYEKENCQASGVVDLSRIYTDFFLYIYISLCMYYKGLKILEAREKLDLFYSAFMWSVLASDTYSEVNVI